MTYSSAVFEPGDNDLAAAQARKYRLLAERAGVRPGENVLEIGCGWGGFAEFAAREFGCKVTGLTISKEQFDFATERMRKAGLADQVTIAMRDYRDETGVFDRIMSIEMFEAVGEGFWPGFFRQMRERLRPGGTAGLQVITIAEHLWPSYRRDVDFIRRYIFPGGMLPTATIMRGLGETYGVPMLNEWAFRQDYAATLAQWRDRFPPPGRSSNRSDSTSAFAACGNITFPIARAASAAARSMCARWSSRGPNKLWSAARPLSAALRPSTLAPITHHGPRERRDDKAHRARCGRIWKLHNEPPRKGDLEAAA